VKCIWRAEFNPFIFNVSTDSPGQKFHGGGKISQASSSTRPSPASSR
jgi:hypothetical protein